MLYKALTNRQYLMGTHIFTMAQELSIEQDADGLGKAENSPVFMKRGVWMG